MKYKPFTQMSETAVRLALRVQYIMGLYYSLQFYEDESIPTLCVNGVACWVNPKFWNQLTRDQKLTATAHEIGHKMLLHPTRRGGRDPFIWNIAGDYVINLMLVESGFVPLKDMTIDGKPWSWCCDEKYAGMTTEQVYDAIIKEAEEKHGSTQSGQGGEASEESDAEGADDSESEGSGDGEGTGAGADGADGGDAQTDAGGKTRAAGRMDRSAASRAAERRLGPMRDLVDFGTDPNGNPVEREGTETVETVADFEQRIRKEVKEAEARAKMTGNTPGWMERVVGNAAHSKVNWWEVVEQYVKSLTMADYSWSRFSRRDFVRLGVIAPDTYQPVLNHLLLFIDTSGSISGGEFGKFCGHYNDLLAEIKPKKVTMVYCDTRPAKVEEFDRCEIVGDEQQLHPVGGGGTDFSWFADFIDGMEERPDVAMCMTDMYTSFGRDPGVPFMWLSTSSIVQAPYGEVFAIN